MNREIEHMICYNCKYFKNQYCNLKNIQVTKQSTCIDYDPNTNPEHQFKNSEEIQREIKLKNLRVDTVYDNVKLFHEEQPFFYDQNQLFWFWDKESHKYILLDEIDLMNSLEKHLALNGHTIKSHLKNEYLESFKRIGRQRIPKTPPEEWIQFTNKIINIHTGEQHKATPEYHFTNPIPQTIGESDKTPILDKIFSEWVGKENVKLLKQIIAFCIVPKYFLHRIFFLVGSGCNGKGSFLEFLKNFIGISNTTSTSLELLLNNRFETVKLYKKLVCLMGETNYQRIEKSDLLKRLSGGDLIGFEFKNKQPFDEVNYSKLIIATNSLPMTLDKTKGFYRRMMIINFPNEFSEKKDVLKTIPLVEYHNLARACISLIPELWENREFHKEGSIEERKQRYEDLSDPLQKFLRTKTIEDPNSYVFKYEFKDKFILFLSNNGYRIWNDKELGTHMKEKFQDAQRGDNNYRVWLGLKWQTQGSQDSQGVLPRHIESSTKGEMGVNPVNAVSKEEFIDEKPKSLKNQLLDFLAEKPIKEFEILDFFEQKGFEKHKILENLDKMKELGDLIFIKDHWRLL